MASENISDFKSLIAKINDVGADAAKEELQIQIKEELQAGLAEQRGNSLQEKEVAREQFKKDERQVNALEGIEESLKDRESGKGGDDDGWDWLKAGFLLSMLPLSGAFGLLATSIGVVLGVIGGSVRAMMALIKAFTPKWVIASWEKLTKFLKINFSNFKLSFIQTIKDAFKFVSGKFLKGIKFIGSLFEITFFQKHGKTFQKVLTGIKSVFNAISGAFSSVWSGVKAFLKPVTDLVSKIMPAAETGGKGFIGSIIEFFGKFGKHIATVAKTVSKIFAPLLIVMGIFDTISAMMEEFGKEDSDFVSIIGAGIKGLVNSIIMAPLDLLKDGISWILDKMGFEDASKLLDSFSFKDLFSKLVDGVEDIWRKLIGAMSNIGHHLSEGFKEIVRAFLPDPKGMVGWMIPDGVYEWAKASPPPPIDMDKETSQGTTPNEQLEIQKKRKKVFQFDSDPAKWTSMQKNQYAKGTEQERLEMLPPELQTKYRENAEAQAINNQATGMPGGGSYVDAKQTDNSSSNITNIVNNMTPGADAAAPKWSQRGGKKSFSYPSYQ